MASAKANAAAKTEVEEAAEAEAKTEPEDQPYSPSAEVMVEDDPELPDLTSLIGSSGAPSQTMVRGFEPPSLCLKPVGVTCA